MTTTSFTAPSTEPQAERGHAAPSMTTAFYRLCADPRAGSRWSLKAPIDREGVEIDSRLFTAGARLPDMGGFRLPVREPGDEVDFNFCDFDMVVTPARVNAALAQLAGAVVQRFPVDVEGSSREYEILNVCDLVPCVDETRTYVMRWGEADGRPDKVGEYRMLADLRINAEAAAGHHMFRIAGWPIALIVSQETKQLFEQFGVTGVSYQRVD